MDINQKKLNEMTKDEIIRAGLSISPIILDTVISAYNEVRRRCVINQDQFSEDGLWTISTYTRKIPEAFNSRYGYTPKIKATLERNLREEIYDKLNNKSEEEE